MPPPLWIASIYPVMSIVTFAAYGIEHRAKNGQFRIRERTLHLLELAGGWPGAVLGQVLFHHKTRKETYMPVVVGIMVLYVALWAACYRMGWVG